MSMLPVDDKRACLIVALCALSFYAVGIGGGSHFDSDDAIYAQMAREMLRSGDYVDNRWLDVVHFEKPPVLFWALALSAHFFGFGEAALRWPVTIFSVGGLVAFYLVARALGLQPRASLTATALLACSTFYLLMTRRIMTDIPLLACALWSAAFALRGRPVSAGLSAGLAVLAKGPAAVPLVAGVCAFVWSKRHFTPRSVSLAAVSAIVVALPWHALVSLRHGFDFWSGYVGFHVFSRLAHEVMPGLSLGERVEVLLREHLLLLLAFAGLVLSARKRFAEDAARFALFWLTANVIPIVFSSTVSPHYLLTLTPALALFAVCAVPPLAWNQRLAPVVAGAVVLGSLLVEPAKIQWWLRPDFSPDQKEMGEQLGRVVRDGDLVATYNLMNSGLIFYSGGVPVSMYSDDETFLAMERRTLMMQRQAKRPGGVFDLRASGLPSNVAGRRFVVTRAGAESQAIARTLQAQRPGRALYVARVGALRLVNDAGAGEALVPY